MSAPKEYRRIVKAAQRAGWLVEHSRSGHIKWYNSDGKVMTTTTNSNGQGRGYRNHLAFMKRHGIVP